MNLDVFVSAWAWVAENVGINRHFALPLVVTPAINKEVRV